MGNFRSIILAFALVSFIVPINGSRCRAESGEAPGVESEPPVSNEAEEEESFALEGERWEFASAAFEAKCALCHDNDGRAVSFGDVRANLVDGVWHHGQTLEDIVDVIRNGVPETLMKPQGDDYSAEELVDLAKYVKLLAQEKHVETEESELEGASELTSRLASTLPPAETIEVEANENFIDDAIFGKMEADGIPHAGLSTDTEFMRRVYLDLWGRIPDAAAVRGFVADTDPDKRNKLIDRLLGLDYLAEMGKGADDVEFGVLEDDYKGPWQVEKPFISKWTHFFAHLFASPGFFPEFHDYLHEVIKYNVPYDYVVREIMTATALHQEMNRAIGFMVAHQVNGVRCRDVMHEDTIDEITVTAFKRFLGVNLECIGCHDGAGHVDDINLWLSKRKRVEFWRQAAFLGNIRIFRPDFGANYWALMEGPALRPERIWRGGIAFHEFSSPPGPEGGLGYRMEAPSVLRVARDRNADVYPEFMLTKERPADGANRRAELARMITSSFQFAKATANAIWSRFMTVGIVDPPFEWDLDRQDPKNPPPEPWTIQPSHPELLDELARYFQNHNFDLRHLMRVICRSRAYQLSSRFEGEYKPEYDRYYARKLVRRLSAEEIYDALAKATNQFGYDIQWAMEMKGNPSDPELASFLGFLAEQEGEAKSSIVQASLMLNSVLVKKKAMAAGGGSRINTLLNKTPPPSNMELAEELFLTTLSRFPTAEEMVRAVKHIEDYRVKGVEDLQWVLFNKLEFIVNY